LKKNDLLKPTLAAWLVLMGWINSSSAGGMADCCIQFYKDAGYEQAFPLCRTASEQGDSHAQYILGKLYYFGKGIQQDYAEAVKWYLKAAEQGYAKAQFNLAVAYARGEGLLQSGGTAADWYYKAGLSYLKKGKKDNALRCVERIKYLKKSSDLSESKALLADKLLTSIHGDVTSKTPSAPGKNQK